VDLDQERIGHFGLDIAGFGNSGTWTDTIAPAGV